MAKQFKVTDEIYFQCKTCDKFLFKILGAITHLKRKHGIDSKMDELEKHCKVVPSPPPEVIAAMKQKSDYQKNWRTLRRATARKGPLDPLGPLDPPGPNIVHYECRTCGKVLKKAAIYNHARKLHGKTASEVGFIETTKPVTRKSIFATPPSVPSPLMDSMPRLVSITDSKVTETGILLTVEIEVATPFVAAIVFRTLS